MTSSAARARSRFITAITAIAVLAAASARAVVAEAASEQVEPPPAHLDLVAPPGCATSEELETRVTQRSAHIRFSPEPGAGLALRVAIVSQPAGAVAATLEIAGADGSRSERRLDAATCGEALDALALMIAVLLDPRALIAPPPPARPPQPAALVEVAAPVPPLPPRRWGVVVGAEAHTISGPMPEAAPGLAVGVAVAPEPGTGHRFWSPAARLRWAHSWVPTWQAPGGTADFTLDSLELDVCPVALGTAGFAARACAAAIGSRIVARGSQTFSAETHVEYLMAAGAAVWLALRVAPHVALEGTLVGGLSLQRDSFAFRPATFYRVAPMTLAGSLGLGLTFP